MVDRLETLLEHFSVSARVFNTSALCGITDVDGDGPTGQLHLIRAGEVEVLNGGAPAVRVVRPSLLLYPRPLAHRFITDPVRGADFACAQLGFEGGAANPIAAALPPFTCIALDELDDADSLLRLLFDEASKRNCGRQAVLDRLFEVVLIHVLRHLMERGQTAAGMLAGLSHARLRVAIVAMHDEPARNWSLDTLAASAGMSRSVFARVFRETVGCTPGLYLQRWRIGIAQKRLRQGRALRLIADDVGYGSEAALSRAFKAVAGTSPRSWLQASA
ncbi:MAG: AraC family transcriptional regulator [Gammaproteobacteria bacterium]|nr:AraC family transcriptional regulator [Gammaproteobacteria bacterium]